MVNPHKPFLYTLLSTALRCVPFYYPQVIVYHRVVPTGEHLNSAVLSTELSVFIEQMDWLLKSGFSFASLDAIVRYVKGEISLPGKTIAITFDDGFQDNYKYAYPVLKKRNLHATIFLTTSFMGKTLAYQDTFWQPSFSENKNTQFNFLSWEEIEIMYAHGIAFEPHTHTHVDLTAVSELQAEEEIVKSRDIIEKRLGKKSRHFGYPYGLFNEKIMNLLGKKSFDAGWTVASEKLARGLNIYKLPRNGNIGNASTARLQVVLSPFYNLIHNTLRKNRHKF